MRRQLIASISKIVLAVAVLSSASLNSKVKAGSADAIESGPEAVFKANALTKVGFFLVTPQEAEVHTEANMVRGLKAKVVSETLARASLSRSIDTAEKYVGNLNSRLSMMSTQMKQLKESNPDKYNQLVNPYNNTLKDFKTRLAQLEDLRARQGRLTDSQPVYADGIVEASNAASAATAQYARLAEDSELASAIDKFNQGVSQPVKLGPSGGFVADAAYLKKCVGEMTSEGVPVRMEIGVPMVEVIINDKRHEMIWDSGATCVSLSSETAAEMGLHVSDRDPTIEGTLADGSKVKNKLIIAPLIRVGPFMAENVECMIAPPSSVRPPDLLGDAFQKHFLCRMDQRAGILHLTPLETPKAGARPGPQVASIPTARMPGAVKADPARPAEPAASIKILDAKYGSPGKTLDVTSVIAKVIAGNQFAVVAADSLLGDPAPGAGKRLRLRYSIGNNTVDAVALDGETIVIPEIPSDGVAIPGDSKAFKVVAARFGAGVTWSDVTDAVRKRVVDPSQPVQYSDTAADIAFGVHKHLVVWFNSDGRRYCRAFLDVEVGKEPLIPKL